MSSSATVRPLASAALALALLCASLPRAAAAAPALELFYGPDRTEWLTLKSLGVVLDGQPLQVQAPARDHDPAAPVLRAPLTPGVHKLEVETGLEGDSSVFTYVEGHRFTMRGILHLDVMPGDVIEVRAKVVDQPGVTVQWQDRFRLALDATVRRTAVAEVEAPPAPAAAPAVAAAPIPVAPTPVAPAAAPAAAPARPDRAPAAPCALEPIRFAFAKATVPADGEVSLDRLAACLVAGGRAVRLEGHTDSLGPSAYNEWLGAQRAAAAARRLREQGVPPERITVRSMSAGSPACLEGGPGCNARNRRVEAVVVE